MRIYKEVCIKFEANYEFLKTKRGTLLISTIYIQIDYLSRYCVASISTKIFTPSQTFLALYWFRASRISFTHFLSEATFSTYAIRTSFFPFPGVA